MTPYPVAFFDLAIAGGLGAVLVIQLGQALLLYRLRGEVGRSTPGQLTQDMQELRNDIGILTSVFDPQYLVRLRQNDSRQQTAIDVLQRETNTHRELIVDHAHRIGELEKKHKGAA